MPPRKASNKSTISVQEGTEEFVTIEVVKKLLEEKESSIKAQFEAAIKGPYYSLAVRRFQTVLRIGLRIFLHFGGGLWLTNHDMVMENHCFFARFSVFMHFHEGIAVLEVAVSV